MNIFTDPETTVLWLILLLPVFLSLALYIYVRYLTSRWYKGEEGAEEDEEIACPSTTNACHHTPPPSYIASYQDRIFQTPSPPLDVEKPPDYPSPPSYHASTTVTDDDEEMTLDQVKQSVLLQKRQRSVQT
ncbi:hypothetical protein BCR42DRAFT_392211 [Absidia repens]|uniref:Uncharacterized protein n=1 Tax=Absidia repens TaxID=90262 RepID=A0A1X2IGT1_9FUNG|nr:hypothetical protein BCR42DRAFT_392211 [Absidia repens]